MRSAVQIDGAAAAANNAPTTRLRVLVLAESCPHPPNSGYFIRSWNLLRRLAERHEIVMLCHGEPEPASHAAVEAAAIRLETVAGLPADRGLGFCGRLLRNVFSPYPYSVGKHFTSRYGRRIRQLIAAERFDLVHCEWLPYARYLRYAPELPSFVSLHNIEAEILRRRADRCGSALAACFFKLQAGKMERFERSVLSSETRVAAVSARDCEQAGTWGARNSVVVENGVDLDFFRPSTVAPSRSELLLIGSLDWFPNQDAAEWMIRGILPRIRSRCADATLTVVGRRPSRALMKLASPHAGVKLIGEVEDVRPYLARAALVLVPLRVGGGTRIKILEAFGMGKAVVSTTIGAEGLPVMDGNCIKLADETENFAAAVIQLLGSEEERRRLGMAGRRLAEERYSWDRQADILDAAWQEAAGRRCAGAVQEPVL